MCAAQYGTFARSRSGCNNSVGATQRSLAKKCSVGHYLLGSRPGLTLLGDLLDAKQRIEDRCGTTVFSLSNFDCLIYFG